LGRDVSIAITARDNFTQAITTMRNANTAFNKDLEGLTRKLDQLNKTKIDLKIETDKLKKELQEARKQFNQTGDAADEMALKIAEANFENAQRNLRLVSQNAKQAEKDILSLTDAVSRAESRVSGGGGSVENTLASSLSKAGLGKMLGDSLTNAIHVGISSAFGGTVGNAISTTLSGAITGAAMGSIAGPAGTAIGAAVGLAAGGISAATGYFQNIQETAKAVRQELVENALAQQAADLEAGIDLAASRETSLISFTTLFGDRGLAERYLEEMRTMANTTPFGYDDLAQMSKTLLTFGFKDDQLLPLLTTIGDAGAALGMTIQDMTMVSTALGRMYSSDKATLEYLNLLIERGIPAIDYLAQDSGKTVKEIYEAISKGLISGKDAAAVISYYLGEAFSGSMEQQSKTFSGMMSALEDAQHEMQNAMGEGYNKARASGLQEQIDWLSGENGEKMQEANRLIGEWRASLENERERLYREYMERALQQIEEAGLTGAEAGRVLAQAQIDAQAAYNASAGAKELVKMQTDLIEQTGETLAKDPATYNAGFLVGEAYSKGIMAAIEDSGWWEIGISVKPNPRTDLAENIKIAREKNMKAREEAGNVGGHAWGLRYVPYDNYLARLHQGERVLTASEARAADQKETAPISISGNNFYIREEADIDRVAQQLLVKLRQAQKIT